MEETTQRELRKLGRAIRTARERAGISQEDFAGAAGIDRTYISRIEQGQANLSWEIIRRVARGLGVKAGALITAAGL